MVFAKAKQDKLSSAIFAYISRSAGNPRTWPLAIQDK